MTRTPFHTFVVGCSCLIAFFSTAIPLAGQTSVPPTPEAPVAPVVATIGDVQAFIDALGAFTVQIAPGATAAVLRRVGGAQIADPGFSAFAPGAGLAIVVEDGERVLVALEVTGEQRTNYAGALAWLQPAEQSDVTADGPLLAATAPGMIDGPAGDVARRALDRATHGRLEIGLEMAPLVQEYWPRLRSFCGVIPSYYSPLGPGMETAGRMMEGEARVLLNVLEQTRRVDLVVDVNAEGITFDASMVVAPETRLARLASVCEVPLDPSLLRLIPNSGGVRAVTSAPNDALTRFMTEELSKVAAEMKLGEDMVVELDRLSRTTDSLSGNGMATSVFGENTLFEGAMVLRVEDVNSTLEAYETYGRAMSEGPIAELYRSQGQAWTVTFERNARKIGEIAVHRSRMELEIVGDHRGAQAAKALYGDEVVIEYASPESGLLVVAFGPQKIEDLLSRIGSPDEAPRIAAVEVHGPGGFGYLDLDFGPIMRSVAALPAGPPAADMEEFARAVAHHPMTFAAYSKDGTLRHALRMPTRFFTALFELGRASASPPPAAPPAGAVERVKLQMASLDRACDAFRADHDRWPFDYDELMGGAPNGRIYLETQPIDPWMGEPFIAEWEPEGGGRPVFISYGADLAPGGTGENRDIRSDDR